MITFQGIDINSIYLDALIFANESLSLPTESRFGKVHDFGPAYFEFYQPNNQLLLLRNRKFNPYFAVVESAWILSGRDDLRCLKSIINSYDKFSDDKVTLNGAYGYRMRNAFGIDQLNALINLLIDSPLTRRAVITLFTPSDLLNNKSMDIPCNTTLFFKIRNGRLDLTVINRSNDLFLGIPYNVFAFNVIQHFVAEKIQIEVGLQRHFTDSLHLYQDDVETVKKIIRTNSKEEIENWKIKLNNENNMTKCLIDFHKEIASFDIENILTPYCKNVFENYFKYKNLENPNILIPTLPNDIFGFSVYLWLKSFSSVQLSDTIFDEIYGELT